MPSALIRRLARSASRLVRMPPAYAALRLEAELWRRLDHRPAGRQETQLDAQRLLRCLDQPDLATLERQISAQATTYDTTRLDCTTLDLLAPGSTNLVVELAESTLDGWVCLLGSGPIQLDEINWHKDYKSGLSWPFAHYTAIDAADLDRPNEVKFPWDLSRLHWLLPVGQAYRLTNDERYADFARRILEHWLAANPCGWGVNWACTMEPAMRVFSWTWLYHTLSRSKAWSDENFRFQLLQALYLHLRFIRRNLEITDINGNHLTADAAALVIGGAFFGAGKPRRWLETGWWILQREINRQVLPDGVNFEASVPYHRLVTELFFHAAATLEANGNTIPRPYINRLLAMADYIRAYTKPDGSAPVIGDADDARTLPLGQQGVNDHRYLPQLIRARWAPDTLTPDWRQSATECLWWWGGPPAAESRTPSNNGSRLFRDSGNAVLRAGDDYVFVDCGPVGLGGRGGHGHNDCLSFEATLLGCNLVADPGCPTYTGDWRLRNRFRSTAAHSTPALEDEEINRFVSPRDLWSLHEDAQGRIELWHEEADSVLFRGIHHGYRRLDPDAVVQRTLVLDKKHHALAWEDRIDGVSGKCMHVPLQLAPGVAIEQTDDDWIRLKVDGVNFVLEWAPTEMWNVTSTPSTISPSYGVLVDAAHLEWVARSGSVRKARLFLYPANKPDVSCRTSLCHALEKALTAY